MLSNLRIVSTPSSDSPSQCFPVLLFHFEKARYVFNCPEGTIRSFGQRRIPYGNIRSLFLSSNASIASAGLGGWLITLAEAGHRDINVHGPIGLKHLVATMRGHVRRHDSELHVHELDPRQRPTPASQKEPSNHDEHGAASATGQAVIHKPFFTDEYVDVYALPLHPEGYVFPAFPSNSDWTSKPGYDRIMSEFRSELQKKDVDRDHISSDEETRPPAGAQTGPIAKRHKSFHSPSSSNDNTSLFQTAPFTHRTFRPRTWLTPGSAHADEWNSAILQQMFFDTTRPQSRERYDIISIAALAKTLSPPPLPPSMVPLPTDSPSSSATTFTPQPFPPLLLSYVLQGKAQRGKFDPQIASTKFGVVPGVHFSHLADGRDVEIQRPVGWEEWDEIRRKIWLSRIGRKKKKGDHTDIESVPLETVKVLSTAVTGKTRPGPVVIMLQVPSPAYISSLVSKESIEKLRPFMATTQAESDNVAPTVIVHTGPREVLTHPDYVDLINKFHPEESLPGLEDLQITHILANQKFCADTLAFPSSNLIHLRCSQLDPSIFQVPDYQLKGEQHPDSLGSPPGNAAGAVKGWPKAWLDRTVVGFADQEASLRPKDPSALPGRYPHGAPVWDFYAGPRLEQQTEADKAKARQMASFDVVEDESMQQAQQRGDEQNGQQGQGKKKEKRQYKKAAAAMTSQADPGEQIHDTPSASQSTDQKLPQMILDAQAARHKTQAELDEARRQKQLAKQAAWEQFQSLAATIKSEIAEEDKEVDAQKQSQWSEGRRRLWAEGQGVVITPLGTGSASPSKYRNVSATLVQLPPLPNAAPSEPPPCILLDAGEGTYGQLYRKFGKEGVERILCGLKLLFISHSHADHHMGVARVLIERRKLSHRIRRPLFVVTNWYMQHHLGEHDQCESLGLGDASLSLLLKGRYQLTSDDQFRKRVADIVSRSNLVYFLRANYLRSANLTSTQPRIGEGQPPPTPAGAELESSDDGQSSDSDVPRSQLRVLTEMLHSALLDSLQLDVCDAVEVRHTKAKQNCYGIVVRQKASPPSAQNGSEGTRAGFSFAYSGDTRPCEDLVRASRGVTVMIHEATIQDGREKMADLKGHSTFAQAIDVGRRAGAACTLLTHFSQRYPKLPRLTRRWEGYGGMGPNGRMHEQEEELVGAEADDDDAILNAMSTADRNGLQFSNSVSDSPAPPKAPENAKKDGMVICTSFDLASMKVPDLWKMERYIPALELLFDADEEEKTGSEAGHGGADVGGDGFEMQDADEEIAL
ncbi:hypothetical protein OC846_001402 [Tilletia horrida]|uniref:ribonuclease Z n=1 Tax=Tilletia horrida TaxID=155126 RepID=A0AAN6GTZ5_9BASI|nr:hypothetical protein OC845_001499 [Tilletia horrida]KAK0556072.1 hypothetical protein OC846_001402 [Tilletia horrida]KAK0568753.1 hypothetical protein OC861_001605 [Tilletia horrida]